MELDETQVKYAYSRVRYNLSAAGVARRDMEDLAQYAMLRVVARCRRGKPKGSWKTFLSLAAQGAVVDALRNHASANKVETVPLDRDAADGWTDIVAALDLIDDELDRRIARMLYEGCTPLGVCAALGLPMEEYYAAKERIRAALLGG